METIKLNTLRTAKLINFSNKDWSDYSSWKSEPQVKRHNRDLIIRTYDDRVYRIKGGYAAIDRELSYRSAALAAMLVEKGLTEAEAALAASDEGILRTCSDNVRVIFIEPGELNLWKVSGTYFGSGSYNASFYTTDGVEIISNGMKDTGFAVEYYSIAKMNSGDIVRHYQSASPGSSFERLYVCR